MKLNQLMHCDSDVQVTAVCDDSRSVISGAIFVARNGSDSDGHQYIDKAIDQGASVIVYQKEVSIQHKDGIVYCPVDDPDFILRKLTKSFYGNASDRLSIIGITGTNGKTSTMYLADALLSSVQRKGGLIGTVHYRINDNVIPARNTTPGFVDNYKYLASMVKGASDYCLMEVSSHALDQGRVDGIGFKGAVFTNLSGDHLDYHKTMDAYAKAKAKLFSLTRPDGWHVINADDEFGAELVAESKASRIMTYGMNNKADLMAEVLESSLKGTKVLFSCIHGQLEIETPLIGRHNIYNLLTAAAIGLCEDLTLDDLKIGLELANTSPGRLERVSCGQSFHVFIDYAHTHDGLENVLNALRPIKENKLITVFGCGGNRDKTKRPKMGEVAGRLSDYIIVTSDNPRDEDPQAIINDIIPGLQGADNRYEVIVERKEAIDKALEIAQPGDIVLLAGKGHETYQIVNGQYFEFDERRIIEQYLR